MADGSQGGPGSGSGSSGLLRLRRFESKTATASQGSLFFAKLGNVKAPSFSDADRSHDAAAVLLSKAHVRDEVSAKEAEGHKQDKEHRDPERRRRYLPWDEDTKDFFSKPRDSGTLAKTASSSSASPPTAATSSSLSVSSSPTASRQEDAAAPPSKSPFGASPARKLTAGSSSSTSASSASSTRHDAGRIRGDSQKNPRDDNENDMEDVRPTSARKSVPAYAASAPPTATSKAKGDSSLNTDNTEDDKDEETVRKVTKFLSSSSSSSSSSASSSGTAPSAPSAPSSSASSISKSQTSSNDRQDRGQKAQQPQPAPPQPQLPTRSVSKNAPAIEIRKSKDDDDSDEDDKRENDAKNSTGSKDRRTRADVGTESRKTRSKPSSSHPPGKPLMGVVFVISGIQNPERSNLRDKALSLGAQYLPDWKDNATHLICPIKNTPKFNEVVSKKSGIIVLPEWIDECYKKKKRVGEINYLLYSAKKLAKDDDDAEDEDEEEDEDKNDDDDEDYNDDDDDEGGRRKNKRKKTGGKTASKRKGVDDDDEDEEKSDGDDWNFSGSRNKSNRLGKKQKKTVDSDEEEEDDKEFFKGVMAYLFKLDESEASKLKSIVERHGGKVAGFVGKQITHLVASKWRPMFADAKRDNPSLTIVEPTWILDSANRERLLSTLSYVLNPSN